MLLPVILISKPYMVDVTRFCHSVRLFRDTKYQKFLTWLFFLIHSKARGFVVSLIFVYILLNWIVDDSTS